MPAAPKTSRTAARYAAGWRSRMPTSSSRPPASTWPRITRAISRTSRSSPGAATISTAGRRRQVRRVRAGGIAEDGPRPAARVEEARLQRVHLRRIRTPGPPPRRAAPARRGRGARPRRAGPRRRSSRAAGSPTRAPGSIAASSRTFGLSGNAASRSAGPSPARFTSRSVPSTAAGKFRACEHPGEVAAFRRHRLAGSRGRREAGPPPPGAGCRPSSARGTSAIALGQLGKRHHVDPGDPAERAAPARHGPAPREAGSGRPGTRAPRGSCWRSARDVLDQPRFEPPHRGSCRGPGRDGRAHPDAVTVARPGRAARTASAMGLQANQRGKARAAAGIPSIRTRPARIAAASVVRPSHTR